MAVILIILRGAGGAVVVATGACLRHSVAASYFIITPAANKGNVPYKTISAGSNVLGNLMPETNTSYHETTACDIHIILIGLFRSKQAP